MSLECDIAAKVVKKKRLQAEIEALNSEIKDACKTVKKAFAVEYDGYAVTVKPFTGYNGYTTRAMPITTVVPLVEHC